MKVELKAENVRDQKTGDMQIHSVVCLMTGR
jgi:hypothetical protein